MDGDKFISTKQNLFNQQSFDDEDDNFFVKSDGISKQRIVQSEPLKHLNDYDSNILQDGAYRDVNDDIFKLEYKISRIEDELKEIGKQIQTANEIYDYYLVDSLNSRRIQLEEDLNVLTELYKEASLSAKISGGLTSKIKTGFFNIGKYVTQLGENLLSKVPGKFSTIKEVRSSLSKLENINKSVDELMRCNYPYGEAEYRYEQLSRYIARANSLQTEIYKFMK